VHERLVKFVVSVFGFLGFRALVAVGAVIGGSCLWPGGVAGAATFSGCGGRASAFLTGTNQHSIIWGGSWPSGGVSTLFRGRDGDKVQVATTRSDVRDNHFYPSDKFEGGYWTIQVSLPTQGACLSGWVLIYSGYWHGANNPYEDLAGFLGQADRLH